MNESLTKLIRRAQEQCDPEEIVWTMLGALSASVDTGTGDLVETALGKGVPFAGIIISSAQVLRNIHAYVRQNFETLPNPFYVMNGYEQPHSNHTYRYFRGRARKNIGASAVALAGNVTSIGTIADIPGIIQRAHNAGTTSTHIHKFRAMAQANRRSVTLSKWLEVILALKGTKVACQTTEAIMASVAGAGVAGASIGIAGNLAAAIARMGVKAAYASVCSRVSMEIHWRAFQEQVLLRGHGSGPASRIMGELLLRRGANRLTGQYNVRELIREPGGWMVINDKLMLI